jgi:hypothetical protein
LSRSTRKLFLGLLLGLVVVALGFYLLEGPTLSGLGMSLFLIFIWTPIKGLLYQRLEGQKPYQSALAANASSELAGLPFHLELPFWPLMTVSFLVSGALEVLALAAMGTATTFRRCLFLAFYGSLVVHLMTAGWFASQRNLALGVPFLLAGIVLLHAPSMK